MAAFFTHVIQLCSLFTIGPDYTVTELYQLQISRGTLQVSVNAETGIFLNSIILTIHSWTPALNPQRDLANRMHYVHPATIGQQIYLFSGKNAMLRALKAKPKTLSAPLWEMRSYCKSAAIWDSKVVLLWIPVSIAAHHRLLKYFQ